MGRFWLTGLMMYSLKVSDETLAKSRSDVLPSFAARGRRTVEFYFWTLERRETR